MGIFSSIKDAIFGKKESTRATTTSTTGADASAPSVSAQPTYVVDVEEILSAKAAATSQDLNWRTSIVDLMKLLDIDSSLSNRKMLAQELGYTGELNGSAEMNIWLHKAVMHELERNGGRVPADLKN